MAAICGTPRFRPSDERLLAAQPRRSPRVDEGRVGALLQTSIIAACTTYALASCLRAYWMETRAVVTQHTFGSGSDDANSAEFGDVMLQSGYAADRIMPIMLDTIKATNNES